MNIYNDYLENIKSAMALGKRGTNLSGVPNGLNENLGKGKSSKVLDSVVSGKRLLPSLETFANELGLTANFEQQLGLHPDFAHLKSSNNIESHYIVSMFIDIKGSTNLFKKYNPETVFVITNTIQKAAIHTCLIFGGYIHRLQGDGLFVYFGGKNITKQTAIERALQSSSVFTYFVQNDLKNVFTEQGVENIFTRIGIDLGYDRDVIWAMAGIGDISEVTTCSLHTSLAAKMQGYAVSNGIVIGDNIKKEMSKWQEFFAAVSLRTKNENDRYIFKIPEEGFLYTQYDFNWISFLKRQEFIATDISGNLNLKRKFTRTIPLASENIKSIASISKPYDI